VLPFFFPEAIWGLTVGCLIANFFSPFGPIDIIFGTLCTFVAAVVTYLFRWVPNKRLGAYLGVLPPILINGFGVGFYVSCISTNGICSLRHFSFPVYLAVAGSIALGELASAGLGGSVLITYLLTKGKHLYSLPRTNT
ncbi:MAG: QueT transporter family protein, partial [Caldisericia bacterium]|nr:QueT transporter family protein [Caldisericia bacterium]